MPERSHRARNRPGYRLNGLRLGVGRRPGARTIGLVKGHFGAEGVPGAGIFSRRDREVANRMRAYWTNFARTGDPNGPDLPRWDAGAIGDRPLNAGYRLSLFV